MSSAMKGPETLGVRKGWLDLFPGPLISHCLMLNRGTAIWYCQN